MQPDMKQDMAGNSPDAAGDAQGNSPDQAQDDPLKPLMIVQEALGKIMEGVQGGPPEALQHLKTAIDEYNAFLSVVTGQDQGGPSGPQSANGADAMSGSNPNAKAVA